LQIFNSPPTKFSKTDHLASTITQVQQIQNGRWVLMKDSPSFRRRMLRARPKGSIAARSKRNFLAIFGADMNERSPECCLSSGLSFLLPLQMRANDHLRFDNIFARS